LLSSSPAAAKTEEPPNLKISSRPVSPLADPLTTMSVAAAADAKPDRSGTRRVVLLVGAAVVLIAVAVGAYALTSGSSKAGGSDAFSKAVGHTLHHKSVQMTFSLNVGPGGSSASAGSSGLAGTGAFEFSSKSGIVSISSASAGSEQMLFIGDTVYFSYAGVRELEPGKTWISTDPGELASASAFASGASTLVQILGNPATTVHALRAPGVSVTSLGSSTYDGKPVHAYRVVLSSGAAKTETVYVGSDNLLQAIVVPVSVEASGTTFHETLTVSFANYGIKVAVAPPLASSVVSFTQFEAVQNAAPAT
jgi:hypothetical protein